MTAEQLLAWTHRFFWPRVCLTCSWQKQSSVLVHMVAELGLRMDTVELDTHLFFRESYDTRDALVEKYQLKLIQPSIPTIAEQHRAEGANLWERDPDRCCHIRKVEPLVNALQPYDAWISGIRRDQSPSRADTPKIQWSERYQVFKLHPLADWDEKRVWPTSRSMRSPTTRCTTRVTVPSAASPARGPRASTRRSGPAAGPGPTSSSAASTPTQRWKGRH